MKKLISLVLALSLALSLAACGSSSGTPAADKSAAPSDASAAAGETYKVGIANWVDHASLNQIVDNIQSELETRGKELGCTFEVEYSNAQADATVLNQISADMIADQVDVIVAIATPVATVMQTATESNQIPVIFSAVSDPVGAGLVESMEAPGGNITGTSDALNTASIMDLIFAANPDADSIGLLYDTAQDSSTAPIAEAKAYLDSKGVKYVEKTGSTTDEIKLAAESLIADGVKAVFTPTDNTVMTAELSLYETFNEAKVPQYTGADSFALNGAFLGYGVDYANLGVETADMIVDVLVNGADPASTPVRTFDNGAATINTDAAEAMGFDLDALKESFGPLCTSIQEVQTAANFE